MICQHLDLPPGQETDVPLTVEADLTEARVERNPHTLRSSSKNEATESSEMVVV